MVHQWLMIEHSRLHTVEGCRSPLLRESPMTFRQSSGGNGASAARSMECEPTAGKAESCASRSGRILEQSGSLGESLPALRARMTWRQLLES